ncbi:Homocysteine S-methyltransferase [Artomyces pyxidatus]|uniref:Homocysteine S-methyltransferase n=1 Tax=Artomyces pyxidatus TaxID=48021 RepID=A0ACB8SPV2_9AGAM|nr:Homocysteine S-methyltransferase [Artomyces pyxidatus]
MANISKIFKATQKDVVLLDGGLGTTLEDIFHVDISSPVWSAKPIDKDPEVVIQAHLQFLRAGARVIDTASYQAASSTFGRAGYSLTEAKLLMRKSVGLAGEARRRFVEESDGKNDVDVKIALSLGPFGATLLRPHEFDGFYPPPYGPQAYDANGTNRNAFTQEEKVEEVASMDMLTDFHLDRLRVFSEDWETWAGIDFVVFETVPLAREIEAVRRAMSRLRQDPIPSLDWKPWWISTVYPGGQFPETARPGSGNLTVQDVVTALFRDAAGYEPPDAFGVNCTVLEHVATVVEDASRAITADISRKDEMPWLFLKPNGGQMYDVSTRKWGAKEHTGEWVDGLKVVVQSANAAGVWGGIMVGGCCKTGPEDIYALAGALGSDSSTV